MIKIIKRKKVTKKNLVFVYTYISTWGKGRMTGDVELSYRSLRTFSSPKGVRKKGRRKKIFEGWKNPLVQFWFESSVVETSGPCFC